MLKKFFVIFLKIRFSFNFKTAFVVFKILFQWFLKILNFEILHDQNDYVSVKMFLKASTFPEMKFLKFSVESKKPDQFDEFEIFILPFSMSTLVHFAAAQTFYSIS